MASLLVLGGARSGKSRFAQAHLEASPGRLAFIATAEGLDDEMRARIARHRADRGARWTTIEAPLDLAGAIAQASTSHDALLVDCLTLWLSNLMHAGRDVEAETDRLCAAIRACRAPVALVSNEVGLGIVPEHELSRRFRDAAGFLNQAVAASVDEAVFVAAGLPLWLKRRAES